MFPTLPLILCVLRVFVTKYVVEWTLLMSSWLDWSVLLRDEREKKCLFPRLPLILCMLKVLSVNIWLLLKDKGKKVLLFPSLAFICVHLNC